MHVTRTTPGCFHSLSFSFAPLSLLVTFQFRRINQRLPPSPFFCPLDCVTALPLKLSHSFYPPFIFSSTLHVPPSSHMPLYRCFFLSFFLSTLTFPQPLSCQYIRTWFFSANIVLLTIHPHTTSHYAAYVSSFLFVYVPLHVFECVCMCISSPGYNIVINAEVRMMTIVLKIISRRKDTDQKFPPGNVWACVLWVCMPAYVSVCPVSCCFRQIFPLKDRI